MSRIGKQPITLASGITASVKQRAQSGGPSGGAPSGSVLEISGPKGKLEQEIDGRIRAKVEGGAIIIERDDDTREARSLHGLYRSLAANMCVGVATGFSKGLEVNGTGYGAEVAGQKLVLKVGFCHPVQMPIPAGLQVTCPTATQVQVTGIDKQKVGDFAARIRRVKPPEPYKGKGIRYSGEIVRRKAGKTLAGK